MTETETTNNHRYVRDLAGKKAYVRGSYDPADELVDLDEAWAWFVSPRTGRYYVVPTAKI